VKQDLSNSHNASFVVSLDFELFWGTRDVETIEACRDRIANIKPTIQNILELFRQYQVHATWATVGFLFASSREDLKQIVPFTLPAYRQDRLSPYRDLGYAGDSEETTPWCYAPSLIKEIQRTPHQEIGTHTFSHYYCLEDGQDVTSFSHDLDAAYRAASLLGIELRSIVFPRNQINADYLPACAARGITSYRGTGPAWIHRVAKKSDERVVRRALRVVDSYTTVFGHNTVPMEELEAQRAPYNLPGTRHFRPALMETTALRNRAISRILTALDHAVKHRHLFHLWFHPEDFCKNTDDTLNALRKVVEHYSALRAAYQIESFSMSELAERLAASSLRPSRSGL
jgi:peptidoglycan/xylan/chitin deacetylase (PgdA/CDA1 family)